MHVSRPAQAGTGAGSRTKTGRLHASMRGAPGRGARPCSSGCVFSRGTFMNYLVSLLAIHVRSPAPPLVALVGLLGMALGEQAPQRWRPRRGSKGRLGRLGRLREGSALEVGGVRSASCPPDALGRTPLADPASKQRDPLFGPGAGGGPGRHEANARSASKSSQDGGAVGLDVSMRGQVDAAGPHVRDIGVGEERSDMQRIAGRTHDRTIRQMPPVASPLRLDWPSAGLRGR